MLSTPIHLPLFLQRITLPTPIFFVFRGELIYLRLSPALTQFLFLFFCFIFDFHFFTLQLIFLQSDSATTWPRLLVAILPMVIARRPISAKVLLMAMGSLQDLGILVCIQTLRILVPVQALVVLVSN